MAGALPFHYRRQQRKKRTVMTKTLCQAAIEKRKEKKKQVVRTRLSAATPCRIRLFSCRAVKALFS